MNLEIVFENDELIAINKPHGLLVHRTKIANDATEFALQLLRDQIGQKVYPAHRIDRKTSGVLLFSKSKEVDSAIQFQFRNHLPNKTYKAIVRGFTPEDGIIEYSIGETDKKQNAITEYKLEEQYEINIPLGKHSTSRYSLITVFPKTGRFHQIRKHMSHIFHPIIGDRPHGCSKQNRFWKNKFQMDTMMLHAEKLQIEYPKNNLININANLSPEFLRVLTILKSN